MHDPADTEHKPDNDDHKDHNDDDTQPGEEAERGVHNLICSSVNHAADLQQNTKQGKYNPKQEGKRETKSAFVKLKT